MTASVASPGSWRRRSTKEFTVLSLFIALVVFLVHQTTLSRENADLPMDRVVADLETHCPSSAASSGTDSVVTHLPPAFFGLGVWVDSPELLPGVHAALDLMKARLLGAGRNEGDNAFISAATFPPATHSLHSFVRLQSKKRDAAVAELVADAHRAGGVNAEEVTRKLELLASQQQLGMPTMKHAFLPQIGQEVELHGLSLFSVPAEALPEGSRVQCFVAGVRQAYCVFPLVTTEIAFSGEDAETEAETETENDANFTAEVETAAKTSPAAARKATTAYTTHADSLEGEVRAALLSVMTRQMGLRSFKPADVAAWKAQREHDGCVYTIASVKSTLRSIEANTNMVIPLNTRHMFADLERHIASKAFVRAARAADDLQFHPSLTPQLYIPWDHSVVSQLVILLPMVSCTILALRFVVDERRLARARKAQAVTAEKKEQ